MQLLELITQPTRDTAALTLAFDKWTNKYLPQLENEKLIKEITNLRKHVVNGCCSNIPPYKRTSQNETLHSHFNKAFTAGSKFSLLLMECITIPFVVNYGKNNNIVDDLSAYEYRILQLQEKINENSNIDYPPLFAPKKEKDLPILCSSLQQSLIEINNISTLACNTYKIIKSEKILLYNINFTGIINYNIIDSIFKFELEDSTISRSLIMSIHMNSLRELINSYKLKCDYKMSLMSHPYSIVVASERNITNNFDSGGLSLFRLLKIELHPSNNKYIQHFPNSNTYYTDYNNFINGIPNPKSVIHHILPIAISSVTNRAVIIYNSTPGSKPIVSVSSNLKLKNKKKQIIKIVRYAFCDTFEHIINKINKNTRNNSVVFTINNNTNSIGNGTKYLASSNWINPVCWNSAPYENSLKYIEKNNLESCAFSYVNSNKFINILIQYDVLNIKINQSSELLKKYHECCLYQMQLLYADATLKYKDFESKYYKIKNKINYIATFHEHRSDLWEMQSKLLIKQIKKNSIYLENQHRLTLNDFDLNMSKWIITKCVPEFFKKEQNMKCTSCNKQEFEINEDNNFVACKYCKHIWRFTR